jgi:hypothetical protein
VKVNRRIILTSPEFLDEAPAFTNSPPFVKQEQFVEIGIESQHLIARGFRDKAQVRIWIVLLEGTDGWCRHQHIPNLPELDKQDFHLLLLPALLLLS